MMRAEPEPEHSVDQSGDALRASLRGGPGGLSTGMVWSLVIAGLKVRLMRSVITMTAIVLATAFLGYTGFTGLMHRNLAAAAVALSATPGSAEAEAELTVLMRRAGLSVDEITRGGGTDWWMLTMAMLLCMVGIANAMLMSVTERFREIGTMKCLGATDGLVVWIFLLESAFLGLAGGVAGTVLAAVVSLGGALVQFGGFGLGAFPITNAWEPVAMALAAGAVLAVVGAIYPAWIASRMNPVDALRVEE